jgi:hypothetical protein
MPKIRGRSVPVLPESAGDLWHTLMVCLMILFGFIAGAGLLLALAFMIQGHGL